MDSGLKKRLLGAVVLIALAVIFVPMLLPNHPETGSQSAGIGMPPAPSGEMQTRILKVGPDGASAGSDTVATIKDPDHVHTLNLENRAAREPQGSRSALSLAATSTELTSAPTSAGVANAPQSSAPVVAKGAPASAAPAPAPAPSAPVASASPAPLPGGAGVAAGARYTVNLGIYSDRASADKLVANAKRAGFTAMATPGTFRGKPVTRVRVGPFDNRSEAEAARLKLKGVEPVAMTIDAAAPNQTGNAPASALASNQPGAWAVQLAAFGDQASADKLRDRLRGQGFDGYVDSVTTAKGKLWRVRAGPFASRNVAATTQDHIAQKLKIKGDIVTQQ